MKRTMNKFASMLLVLAMLLSLSVTAFAAIPAGGSITATVEFYNGEDLLMDWPVTMTAANATTSYEIPKLETNQYYNSTIVMNDNRPSAMDATLVALEEIGTPEQVSGWGRKYHEDTGLTEIQGAYLDTIFGETTVTTDYKAPTATTAGYWEGNSWLYKVVDADGNVVVEPDSENDVYATNVELEEGMTITWTYTYNIHTVIPPEVNS